MLTFVAQAGGIDVLLGATRYGHGTVCTTEKHGAAAAVCVHVMMCLDMCFGLVALALSPWGIILGSNHTHV